jgi:phosphoribosylformylglycinamidine synthase
MPIVSGNVSLYNETDGTGILPTPTIGAVGLLASEDDLISGLAQEGDMLLVIGATKGHLGQSALLAEAFDMESGDAPEVDLKAERKHGEFLRANRKLLRAATDLSDGGLALAAFEMADAAKTGVWVDSGSISQLFGEDQARYIVACGLTSAADLIEAGEKAGVKVTQMGQFGGTSVCFGTDSAPLAELSSLYHSAFAKAVG